MGVDIVSDQQARAMWCPFGRRLHLEQAYRGSDEVQVSVAGINDPHDQKLSTSCIGPDCMAWRSRVSADERDRRNSADERIGKFSAGGCQRALNTP